MLGEESFLLQTGLEEFVVRVVRTGAPPTAEQRELALHATFELRFGLEQRDPAAVGTARRLARALFEPEVVLAAPAFAPADPLAVLDDLVRRLEQELLAGRLVIEPRRLPSLSDARQPVLPELPPLPPAPVEAGDNFFEARFVDEIGQGISGLGTEFSVDGGLKTVTTNAAGVALLEGVKASSASITVPDPDELAAKLDPRWEKLRPGKPPKESNLFEVVFKGGDVGSFPVKAALPHLIVVKPPLGKLFVELFDKTGRVRLADTKYTITGPMDFEGTTDEAGRLLHEGAFRGDYTLRLTLEFFEGDQLQSDTYEAPLIALDPEAAQPQVRLIGAVPRVILARLEFFFNTNKAFVLPTTLASFGELRDLYLDNNPSEILAVGHADTSGGPSTNDPLSLERAKATIAFLKDDVDAWLAFYEQSAPKARRWGAPEDRMMLTAMPDFRTKPKGEDAVRWFQRTRGLSVDGVAGPQTRRRLIEEYMALDGTSLAEQGIEIRATAHGCGENFPLDESGENLDPAPENPKRDPSDRRVELFFFDPEFGIVPPPPGENSRAGAPEYPAWRARAAETIELSAGNPGAPKAVFVEIADALFRTNSSVVLPEGEAPSQNSGELESLSTVGVFATVLRFNEEHPGKTLLVAGHADTSGEVDFNQKLSEERARNVLALLLGGDEQREIWKKQCHERHKVSDYKQILAWVARAFPDLVFDCDPGPIDDNAASGAEPVRRFQRAYNANKAAIGATGPDLEDDGDIGPLTWGAIFDCYELALEQELGVDKAGLRALRDKLTFADPERKALGFSEHFPVEELGVDNFRSQANRRCEVVFFDFGEEPDLEHAADDPETSELYLPGVYERTPLSPMVSAKPWTASWADDLAQMEKPVLANLVAPGLPPGTPMKFSIFVLDPHESIGSVEVLSTQDAAVAEFQDWDAPSEPLFAGTLAAGQPFPEVFFEFVVEGGGRTISSTNRIRYADRLEMQLELEDGDVVEVLRNQPYVLCSPWGKRKGTTNADGILVEEGLPPGGVMLAVRETNLIHVGVLDHGWDAGAR